MYRMTHIWAYFVRWLKTGYSEPEPLYCKCIHKLRKVNRNTTHPISLRQRNSCATRFGWVVGIRCFNAKKRFFSPGTCSWCFIEVRNTWLNVPCPMRRCIRNMFSTSGIWDFNAPISSAIWQWRGDRFSIEWQMARKKNLWTIEPLPSWLHLCNGEI